MRNDTIDGIFTITQTRVYFAIKQAVRVRAFSGIADFVMSGVGRTVRLPLSGLLGEDSHDDYLQGWIARSAFGPSVTDWAGLRGHVENDIQHLDMDMQVFVEDTTTSQTGHVAGMNANGHVQGWTTKPESGTNELPVLVRLDDARLLALTHGRWASENFRRFDIPLDAMLHGPAVHRLSITGGGTRAKPFGRADSFIMRTPAGLVHGAPVEVTGDRVTGAFQFLGDLDAVMRVSLCQGAHQSDVFNCDQSGAYDFNGEPCGFALPLASFTQINPIACDIVLRSAQGEVLGSFALNDFMSVPDHL